MELKEITIKNFRSIKDAKINFIHNCMILVGKNEAGKSNILKAIASLFNERKITSRDRRKRIANETIEDFYIEAKISLSTNDLHEVVDKFQNKYKNTENLPFQSGIGLKSYVRELFSDIYQRIEIEEGAKPVLSYLEKEDENWGLLDKIFITGNKLSTQGETPFSLKNDLFEMIKELYSKKAIKCHYWEYSENYLLPSSVDIKEFKENPSSFKALQNIFQLCKRGEIKKEFESAFSQDGDYLNLLEQISVEVTNVFRKIWPDMKKTSIEIAPDGNLLRIKIVDKVRYNCEDRSDGFKKFISILLMLSTQSRAERIIENDLILIDEPDQSLYPTSARYLRDELFNISERAKIIYSTHSQFMLDPDNMNRHILVEKRGDISELKAGDEISPYADDELLRRAIGVSIFEVIKPINIVFEGYLDKMLFEKYVGFENIKNKVKNFGRIYLAGISGVDAVTSILISANKKFIIVADSDPASKGKRSNFKDNFPEHENFWLAYADQVDGVETMEDFIDQNAILGEIQKLEPGYNYNSSLSAMANISAAVNNDRNKKQMIKNALIQNILKNQIMDSYNDYFNKLLEELGKLK